MSVDAMELGDALNVLTGKSGHIAVSLLPGAVASLFTGRVVIGPHEPRNRVRESDDFSSAMPKGLVSLRECAEYLTDRFGLPFTSEELSDLADAGQIPHVRVRGKGVSVYCSKVARWVSDNLVSTCDGSPILGGVRSVYVPSERLPHDIPTCLTGLDEHLCHLDTTACPPCVYFLCLGRNVQYVGQSVNLLSRVGQHAADAKEFDRVFFIPVSRPSLSRVEAAFIRLLHPPLNGTLGESPAIPEDVEIVEHFGMRVNTCGGSDAAE